MRARKLLGFVLTVFFVLSQLPANSLHSFSHLLGHQCHETSSTEKAFQKTGTESCSLLNLLARFAGAALLSPVSRAADVVSLSYDSGSVASDQTSYRPIITERWTTAPPLS